MALHAHAAARTKTEGQIRAPAASRCSYGTDIDPSRRAHCRLNITRPADRIGASHQRGCGVDHASGMVMVNAIARGPGSQEHSHAPLARAGGTVPGLAVFLVGVLQRRVCGSVCVGPCWIASGRLGAARRGITRPSLRTGMAARVFVDWLRRRPRLLPRAADGSYELQGTQGLEARD